MFEDREQLEFAISQYLDGTLSPVEHEALENKLREDREAAELLREYRELESALRAPAKLPNFNWEAVAQQISAHVDEVEAPAVVYKFPWSKLSRTQTATLALAACLLLAFGVVTSIMLISQSNGTGTTQVIKRTMLVKGPSAEHSPATKVVQIAIGPAPDAQMDSPIIQRTPIVSIAAENQLADNIRTNPFD